LKQEFTAHMSLLLVSSTFGLGIRCNKVLFNLHHLRTTELLLLINNIKFFTDNESGLACNVCIKNYQKRACHRIALNNLLPHSIYADRLTKTVA